MWGRVNENDCEKWFPNEGQAVYAHCIGRMKGWCRGNTSRPGCKTLAIRLRDPSLSGGNGKSQQEDANPEVTSTTDQPTPWDIKVANIKSARDIFLAHHIVVIRGYSRARWGNLDLLRAAWNNSSAKARQSITEKCVVRKNLARTDDRAPPPSRPLYAKHLVTPDALLGKHGVVPKGSWYLTFFAVSGRAPEFTARIDELLPPDVPAEPSFLHDTGAAGRTTTAERIWVFLGRHIEADGNQIEGVGEHIDLFNEDGTWQLQVDGEKTWRVRRPGQNTTYVVTCQEGDMLVLDTSKWYHATTIAAKAGSSSRLSVSLARDFTFSRKKKLEL